jgi:hypothetical protein
MTRRAPGVAVASAGAEAQLRRNRIGELTPAKVLSALAGLGEGAAIADQTDFFWRAGGLLEAEPALCGVIAEQLLTARIGGRATAFALDLLVSAGTPAAQSALRRVLENGPIRSRGDYPMLVQRMSLLESPDDDTVAAAARLREQQGTASPAGGAAAYALGAMANRLAAGGRADDARRWTAPLAAELETTDDPVARARLLGALGNAGLADHVELFVRFSDDADPEVRRGAASALRHDDQPDARAALVRLAGDGDAAVQAAALASLRDRALGVDDAGALAAGLGAGLTGAAAVDAVRLLTPHGGSPEVAAALAALAAAPTTPPEVRAEIRRALAGA